MDIDDNSQNCTVSNKNAFYNNCVPTLRSSVLGHGAGARSWVGSRYSARIETHSGIIEFQFFLCSLK